MAAALMPAVPSRKAGGPLGVEFARHMQLRGRRIEEAAGILWQSVQGGMFISIPCHLKLDLSPEAIDDVLRTARGMGVRFASLTRPGQPGGLYACRDRNYELQSLNRNFRHKVRQGLSDCEVRPVTYDELMVQGMVLNLDTMQRQQRFDAEFGNFDQWRRLVNAVFAVPAMGVVGAFVDGRLSAYEITCREDGWLVLVHKMSRRSDLEHSPNHVLDYCITREAMADPSVEALTMGWQSLASMDGLHEYKIRMGYELEPHHQVIQLHPAISWLATSAPFLWAADRFCRQLPTDANVKQFAGVLHGAAISRTRPEQGAQHA